MKKWSVLFLRQFLTFPSNTSNFIVERTTISYGVNLITRPNSSSFPSGAGIAIRVDPEVGYDVQITITECYFVKNIALNNCSFINTDFQQLFLFGEGL